MGKRKTERCRPQGERKRSLIKNKQQKRKKERNEKVKE